MSYSCLVAKSEANRAACLTDFYAQLEAMGWTKVDYQPYSGSCNPADVDTTNDWITIVGHSFVNGQHIMYSTTGTVIGGLTNLNFYFIVQVSGNTFKLSLTQGGGAINLTSQGTGVHSFVEGYRIYSSPGEGSAYPICYIQIEIAYANALRLNGFYYWNASTHAGLGAISSSASNMATTSESGFYFWIYGNLDWVAFFVKTGTTYYIAAFGFLKKLWSMQTTTTEAGTAGSNVQISVVDNSQFIIGKKYQILGVAQEGRDQVTINALPTGKVQIASLPRNYGSGSIIGETPCPFIIWGYNLGYSYPINPVQAVGTNVAGISMTLSLVVTGGSSPDNRAEQKYILVPFFISMTSGPSTTMENHGYRDEVMLFFGSSTGLTVEDVFGVGQSDSGTSSGSNDATHFNDTSKSWGTDALANLILVITAGTGAGQTRKIASNTGTQITVTTAFGTTPDATSTYAIVQEAYRIFYVSTTLVAILEIV